MTQDDAIDLDGARKQFGLEKDVKADMSTDTVDLQLDIIKDEFIESQHQGLWNSCELNSSIYINFHFSWSSRLRRSLVQRARGFRGNLHNDASRR